jgi:hypothetical protein
LLNGQTPQVFTIKFDQIERAQDRIVFYPGASPQLVEARDAIRVRDNDLAVEDAACNAQFSQRLNNGRIRSDQLCPLRVVRGIPEACR